MTIHAIGPLFCAGLLALATTTGAFAQATNKYNTAKSNSAGVAVTASASNAKTKAACDAAKGVWNAAAKTCAAGGGGQPSQTTIIKSKSNITNN
jgi:hypothetical protein